MEEFISDFMESLNPAYVFISFLSVFILGFVAQYLIPFYIPTGFTFQEYKNKWPGDCANGDQVQCANCHGTQIWVRESGGNILLTRYLHKCKTCGKKLYYTKEYRFQKAV